MKPLLSTLSRRDATLLTQFTQGGPMEDQSSDENEGGGKVDRVAVLYILGGIPAITVFLVGLFALVQFCRGIPA